MVLNTKKGLFSLVRLVTLRMSTATNSHGLMAVAGCKGPGSFLFFSSYLVFSHAVSALFPTSLPV